MASSITGIQLALPDQGGVYQKTKRKYMGTAGIDLSAGGKFVELSGAGVIIATKGADVYGVLLDGVPAATAADGSDDLYVDVYNGLQDKFTATVRTTGAASSLVNGATVFASGGLQSLGLVCALDIVGTIENGSQPVSAGARVVFSLTPSEAIAGYDSGNTS